MCLYSLYALGTSYSQNRNKPAEVQDAKKYDVAAFVWPSYHPDDRAKIFWPMGIGEWETVMKNKAKFEGHEQPRYPLWGYINEADPYVAEMEINAAADHGVNVFIFDWYWYDGMPFLEGQLNDGYLKARNNDRVKFYLMWANHDVGLAWDKRNAGLPNNQLIWKGGVDRAGFEVICHRVIEKYFPHPSYYKVDGKPSFMIYELQTLIQGLGGIQQTMDALDWFRKETVRAGFKGLDLQVTLRKSGSGMTGADGATIGTQAELIKKLGFNGLTHYQFCHYVDAHPGQAPLITINSWNEWTETSYLMPCTMFGYGYLEAVKKVFVERNK